MRSWDVYYPLDPNAPVLLTEGDRIVAKIPESDALRILKALSHTEGVHLGPTAYAKLHPEGE